MKVAITGARGFVGSHLGRTARDLDYPTHEINRDAWDISETPSTQFIDSLMQFEPDVIFHLAALSKRSDCGETNPNQQATAVNIRGTHQLISLVKECLPNARVVFASSSYVYGPVFDTTPVSERASCNPQCGYGKSKLQAEQLIADAVKAGLDAVIVRAFQHSGPGQQPCLILPEWIRKLQQDSKVDVFNLQSYFDLSDVRDVARAYLALAEHGKTGAIYNVGSGKALCSGDLFDEICRCLTIDQNNLTVNVQNPGERFSPIADVTRIMEATGWSPAIPLELTISDTIAAIKSS